MSEHRRAPRRMVGEHIEVLDLMTDAVVGRVGNLSHGGMLLLSHQSLVDDALYQLRFSIGVDRDPPYTLSVGAHVLWSDAASAPGQHWVGLRFIDIAAGDEDFLRRWADTPGARHA